MKHFERIFRRVLASSFALLAAGFVFTACEEEEPPFLTLDQESVIASPEDSRFVIDVKSNVNWEVSCKADWIKVFGESGDYKGSFEILVAANRSAATRSAEVIVSGGGCTTFVNVIQTSGELTLVVPVKEYSAAKDASEVSIRYIVSAPDALVEAFSTADWLSVESVEGGLAKVAIAENTSGEAREAMVKIVATDAAGKTVVCETTIFQAATENILDVLVDSLYVAPAGEVVRIPVVTNAEVNVNCTSDWCSASYENGIVLVTAGANETDAPRAAFVSVSVASGKGFALSKTFQVKQWPVIIDTDELMILVPEFRVKYVASETVIPFAANTTVKVRSNADWCSATLVDSDIIATISENTDTESEREAYVTITTKDGVSGTVHIIQNAAPVPEVEEPEADELEILVSETEFAGEGGEIKLPFTYKSESISARVSSDWLGAVIDGNDVVITARENWSGNVRKGYVALQTADGTAGVISVTESSLEPQFLFSINELNFTSAAAESYVSIASTGSWKLNNTSAQMPGWINVDPTSGEGDCIITVAVSGNKFATPRAVELSFSNTDHNLNAKIAVAQEANPQGISDYMYLGKGYDASGNYAEDQYVKSAVLDCDAMAADDCISDIINMNQTIEEYIRGTTLEEYERNYSAEAGISGKWGNKIMGFQGSIKTNFSSKALGSAEHSFITFRHVTKKQILKVNDNETAATLMDYRSESFISDLAKLDATALVKKYGTHVIMGFSTGGVIDYSMAADVSKMSSSIDLGVAVKAGFEKKAVGKISTEDSFNMYDSISKESNGFEYKLLCRGGESQYTSAGFSSDAQAASAYENWLSSLEDSGKWVMVDYEGSQLIPLWEFIEDAALSAEVKSVSEATLSGTGIKQTSSYKDFSLNFVGSTFKTPKWMGPDTYLWMFMPMFNVTIDNGSEIKVVTEDNSESFYTIEGDVVGCVMYMDNDFKFRFADYGIRIPTTGTHSLSKFKEHTVVLIFSEYMLGMPGGFTSILPEDDGPVKVTLTCPADSNVWTYRDEFNIDHTWTAGSDGIVRINLSLPEGTVRLSDALPGMKDMEMDIELTW